MKSNRMALVLTVGAAGVLALGACSSGSDQAQEGQAQPSREAEAAEPTSVVTMPALKSGPYKDVWVTRDPDAANCKTPYEENEKLIVECKDVGIKVVGDPVFIGVPNDNYRIDVTRTTGAKNPLVTVQRDLAYIKMHESIDAHTVWNSPYSKDFKGNQWGVGLSGKFTFDNSTGLTSFRAVVTKIS